MTKAIDENARFEDDLNIAVMQVNNAWKPHFPRCREPGEKLSFRWQGIWEERECNYYLQLQSICLDNRITKPIGKVRVERQHGYELCYEDIWKLSVELIEFYLHTYEGKGKEAFSWPRSVWDNLVEKGLVRPKEVPSEPTIQVPSEPTIQVPSEPTIQDTLAERGKLYEEFKDHAKISQSLKRAMWATTRWVDLPDDVKEALEMIQHKIARVLNGDPEYDDTYRDVAGYATLVLDRILKDKKGPQP